MADFLDEDSDEDQDMDSFAYGGAGSSTSIRPSEAQDVHMRGDGLTYEGEESSESENEEPIDSQEIFGRG